MYRVLLGDSSTVACTSSQAKDLKNRCDMLG